MSAFTDCFLLVKFSLQRLVYLDIGLHRRRVPAPFLGWFALPFPPPTRAAGFLLAIGLACDPMLQGWCDRMPALELAAKSMAYEGKAGRRRAG